MHRSHPILATFFYCVTVKNKASLQTFVNVLFLFIGSLFLKVISNTHMSLSHNSCLMKFMIFTFLA